MLQNQETSSLQQELQQQFLLQHASLANFKKFSHPHVPSRAGQPESQWELSNSMEQHGFLACMAQTGLTPGVISETEGAHLFFAAVASVENRGSSRPNALKFGAFHLIVKRIAAQYLNQRTDFEEGARIKEEITQQDADLPESKHPRLPPRFARGANAHRQRPHIHRDALACVGASAEFTRSQRPQSAPRRDKDTFGTGLKKKVMESREWFRINGVGEDGQTAATFCKPWSEGDPSLKKRASGWFTTASKNGLKNLNMNVASGLGQQHAERESIFDNRKKPQDPSRPARQNSVSSRGVVRKGRSEKADEASSKGGLALVLGTIESIKADDYFFASNLDHQRGPTERQGPLGSQHISIYDKAGRPGVPGGRVTVTAGPSGDGVWTTVGLGKGDYWGGKGKGKGEEESESGVEGGSVFTQSLQRRLEKCQQKGPSLKSRLLKRVAQKLKAEEGGDGEDESRKDGGGVKQTSEEVQNYLGRITSAMELMGGGGSGGDGKARVWRREEAVCHAMYGRRLALVEEELRNLRKGKMEVQELVENMTEVNAKLREEVDLLPPLMNHAFRLESNLLFQAEKKNFGVGRAKDRMSSLSRDEREDEGADDDQEEGHDKREGEEEGKQRDDEEPLDYGKIELEKKLTELASSVHSLHAPPQPALGPHDRLYRETDLHSDEKTAVERREHPESRHQTERVRSKQDFGESPKHFKASSMEIEKNAMEGSEEGKVDEEADVGQGLEFLREEQSPDCAWMSRLAVARETATFEEGIQSVMSCLDEAILDPHARNIERDGKDRQHKRRNALHEALNSNRLDKEPKPQPRSALSSGLERDPTNWNVCYTESTQIAARRRETVQKELESNADCIALSGLQQDLDLDSEGYLQRATRQIGDLLAQLQGNGVEPEVANGTSHGYLSNSIADDDPGVTVMRTDEVEGLSSSLAADETGDCWLQVQDHLQIPSSFPQQIDVQDATELAFPGLSPPQQRESELEESRAERYDLHGEAQTSFDDRGQSVAMEEAAAGEAEQEEGDAEKDGGGAGGSGDFQGESGDFQGHVEPESGDFQGHVVTYVEPAHVEPELRLSDRHGGSDDDGSEEEEELGGVDPVLARARALLAALSSR